MANIVANVKFENTMQVAEYPVWLSNVENIISTRIQAEMSSHENVALSDWEEHRFDLIWSWRVIDPLRATQWFRLQSGNWGVLQTLMKLVPRGTQFTSKGPVKTLGLFDKEVSEELVGLDDAISKLSEELATAAEVISRISAPDTEPNRRMIVLNALREIAHNRETLTNVI